MVPGECNGLLWRWSNWASFLSTVNLTTSKLWVDITDRFTTCFQSSNLLFKAELDFKVIVFFPKTLVLILWDWYIFYKLPHCLCLHWTPAPPPKEHVPRVDFRQSWHKFSKRKPTSLTELFLKSKERKGIFTHECRLSCGTRVTERLERLCCCSVWLLLSARPGQVKSIRIILPYHFPFWGIKLPRLSFVPRPRASESELCPRRCAIAYKRNPANSICPTPTWILSVQPFSLNCAICLPGSLLPLAFFPVRFFFSHIFFSSREPSSGFGARYVLSLLLAP